MRDIRRNKSLWLASTAVFAISGCAVPGTYPASGGSGGQNGPDSQLNVFESAFANPDPCANNSRNIGVAVGVGLGAILGAVIANKNKVAGAAIGAAAGGLAGGVVGHVVDDRRCALSKIAQKHNLVYSSQTLEVKVPETGKTEQVGTTFTVVDAPSHAQFETGSAELTPEAKIYFGEIAEQYRTSTLVSEASGSADKAAAAKAKILLVGHTDDTGSSELNADLSERRARAVARLFSSHGIAANDVFYQGAGETLPIADNHTADGRAANRRVEIVDLTGARPDILDSYVDSRQPKYQYYRAASTEDESSSSAVAASTKSTAGSRAAAGHPKPTKDRSTENATKSGAVASTSVAVRPDSKVKPGAAENAASDSIDFGWVEANPSSVGLQFAMAPAQTTSLPFLSSAVADELPVSKSCANDRPRLSRSIKSVADDQTVPVRDHLPNLYGSSWGAVLNGQYLALEDVSVLKNGTAPGAKPTLAVWKDYERNGGLSGNPQVRLSPDVNAYAVKGGVLYRVFLKQAGVFNCADIIFSNGKASSGELVRTTSGKYFTVDYVPTIART
jgi:outer membrane protein OmpA-like peptidoglycan-associated protein